MALTDIIDTHHHFWDPEKADYPWLTEALGPINRAFAPVDLAPLLAPAEVRGTILVQTRSSLGETADFLELAAKNDFILGVVGWVDMTSAGIDAELDGLLDGPNGKWLKGIRHQVHDEEDANWLLRPDVHFALNEIEARGLAYDLLIREREIPAALEVVGAFPKMRFVVDHIAKPNIAEGGFASWAKLIEGFVEHRAHVWCKLSGLVTEADWDNWHPDDLQPYMEKVLEVFGANRVMLGSDWPVCLLAATYEDVLNVGRSFAAAQGAEAEKSMRTGAAISAYRL
ncbi:MAG: amidohydrolase family protein [Alphaproteobacteria bacterium]